MGKLLIKKKTEEQVCHDFDQFLPLYAFNSPDCSGMTGNISYALMYGFIQSIVSLISLYKLSCERE